MDDPATYGETFHLLSFKRAMEYDPPILSDYKIISIAVSREEVAELIRKNTFVRPDKGPWNKEIEADMLAPLIALRKALRKYPLLASARKVFDCFLTCSDKGFRTDRAVENGEEPIVLWIEADCSQFGCPDLRKMPVALECDTIQLCKPLNLEIPSFSHGILLSYWKNEASLEIQKMDLRRLFSGLLEFTPFDDLGEFAAVAGEEIREKYGATFEVLALLSAREMGILDHKRAANILISFSNAWHTGGIQKHLDDDSQSIVADEIANLLEENILDVFSPPDREIVVGSIVIFLTKKNKFDFVKSILNSKLLELCRHN